MAYAAFDNDYTYEPRRPNRRYRLPRMSLHLAVNAQICLSIDEFADLQSKRSIVALREMRACPSSVVPCIHKNIPEAEQWPLQPYPIPLVEFWISPGVISSYTITITRLPATY